MSEFIHEDFLLQSKQARELYHDYAKNLPIIDYHCHLDPDLIARDFQFTNLSEIWLHGDHYKWRAMRSNGVDEKFCTGDASDWEKFQKWAETMPYTLRNPLYHWSHLELKRYFGIDELLSPESAKHIYETGSELVQQADFSAVNLLKMMNVEVVCTTDDPLDDLEAHRKIARSGIGIKVLPTYRPDKLSNVKDSLTFLENVERLEEKVGFEIKSFQDFIQALELRHSYFHAQGCRLSDHGLGTFYGVAESDAMAADYFKKLIRGKNLNFHQRVCLETHILIEMARMDHDKGWVQQFHYGALRSNNTRLLEQLGADVGCDSIGDLPVAAAMSRFFDQLDQQKQLAKTIVYNLNPAHNYMLASMIGNFQDGSVPGKIQFGSGWWFLDQKEGMEMQMNALSNLGLLSRFVGMLTDSRSFMSYPRHEYFRRILCNLLGDDMKNGLLPNDMKLLGDLVKNVSYYNAQSYFGF